MQNMTLDLFGSSRDHTFYGPSKGPRFGPQIQGPECGPDYASIFWTCYRDHFNVVPKQRPKWVHILDFLTQGPSIGPDFGPYIGPQFSPCIGPDFGPYIQVQILNFCEGPKSGPRIKGPHSAGGPTKVHEGPHRDHGHVLHKVQIAHTNVSQLCFLLEIFHEEQFSTLASKVCPGTVQLAGCSCKNT